MKAVDRKNTAITPAAQTAAAEPLKPYPIGAVTTETYLALALQYMRASGRKDGDHQVIYNASGARKTGNIETREQWVAWIAYFDQAGIPCALSKRDGICTVPAMYPWEFTRDADWVEEKLDRLVAAYQSDFLAARVDHSPEHCARMRALFADVATGFARSQGTYGTRKRAKDGRD